MRTSTDQDLRRRAWEASKQVGREVEHDLLALVRLRNEGARSLGFSNFYAMSLELDELDERELFELFDELDRETTPLWQEYKPELDRQLGRRFGIAADALRPWHYADPFFQEAPAAEVSLDPFYEGQDLVAVTERYFAAVGFSIQDSLRRSDLFERPGKCQHAFCMSVDRGDDVRVLCNVRPTERWMGTMLHEMGHAVYDKYIDPQLPYLVRTPSHTLSTEAMAMLLGRMSKNAAWLEAMQIVPEAERVKIQGEVRKMLTFEQLLFSRWVQVMVRFERAMYADPNQDLNTLWWDLVERYQLLHRPEGRNAPDFASKYHVAMAPVYYHNYLLGELMASQVHLHIVSNVLHAGDPWTVTYVNQPEVGTYLREQVFAPGAMLSWNELVKHATGELLSPKSFSTQFVAAPSSL